MNLDKSEKSFWHIVQQIFRLLDLKKEGLSYNKVKRFQYDKGVVRQNQQVKTFRKWLHKEIEEGSVTERVLLLERLHDWLITSQDIQPKLTARGKELRLLGLALEEVLKEVIFDLEPLVDSEISLDCPPLIISTEVKTWH